MTIDEAMERPFRYIVKPDGCSDGFVAIHPLLPGCIGQGSTVDDALADLQGARRALFECFLEDDDPIPESDFSFYGLPSQPPELNLGPPSEGGIEDGDSVAMIQLRTAWVEAA